MNITTLLEQGKVPVAIMKLDGALDASCYKEVIASAKQLVDNGARDLLLDMSAMSFMSSAGIFALHNIALLMRGEPLPESEDGWAGLHAVSFFVEESSGYEKHFKLLNPLPRVQQTLEKTGYQNIFEVFTDRAAAIAAFG